MNRPSMDTDHVPEDEKQLSDAVVEAPSPARLWLSQLAAVILLAAGVYAVCRAGVEYPATADEVARLRSIVGQADLSLTNLPPSGERATADWGTSVRNWRDKNIERYNVVRLHLYGCYGMLALGPLALLFSAVVWWRGQFPRTAGRFSLDGVQIGMNATALLLLAGLRIFDSATLSVMAKTPSVPDLQTFLKVPTEGQKTQRLASLRKKLDQTLAHLQDKKSTPVSRLAAVRAISGSVWDKEFVASLSDADKQSFRSVLKELARKAYTDDELCPVLLRSLAPLGDKAEADAMEADREKARPTWVDVKKPEGVRCLLHAVATGREDDVRKLIERGINVNAILPSERHTALYEAVARRQFRIAELLLQNKARVDVAGETSAAELEKDFPIHRAVGEPKLVKLLLDRGTDPNVVDLRGATPLHVAAALGDRESAELLLAKKAKLNAVDFARRTPLDMAAPQAAASQPHARVRDLLVQSGGLAGSQLNQKNSAAASVNPNAR